MYKQENIIEDIMSRDKQCKLTKDIDTDFNRLSLKKIQNILTNDYYNGVNMNALACMFDTLLQKVQLKISKKGKTYSSIITEVGTDINDYISSINMIVVDSVSGFVFMVDFFGSLGTIVKIPRKIDQFNNLKREYFIGRWYMNKLRYRLPNFVYTLGAFMCKQIDTKKDTNGVKISQKICSRSEKLVPYIITEKIDGDTLYNEFVKNSLTIEQYLNILVQVLIALEIAQREFNFTHYDLHTENVMLRNTNIQSYTVNLDDKEYTINPEHLAVIIDYGISSVNERKQSSKEVGNSIGVTDNYNKFRIYNYMIPGYDVYKFMTLSAYTFRNIRNDIMNIFRVYQNQDDPHNIFWGRYPAVRNAVKQSFKYVAISKAAHYTPAVVLDWLINDPYFGEIIQKRVNVRKRNSLYVLYKNNTLNTYNNMFNIRDKSSMDKVKKSIEECMKKRPSYIFSTYNLQLLSKIALKEQLTLTEDIDKLNVYIRNNKTTLLNLDISRLENFFSIKIPDQKKLNNAMSRILSLDCLPTETRLSILKKTETIKGNIDVFDYHLQIENYLDLLYIAAECNLREFDTIRTRIENSTIYTFYLSNRFNAEKVLRWRDTVLSSTIPKLK